MAVILGHTHPDVFAAVASHSGLPRGAAHDVQSAFAAMQGKVAMDGRSSLARTAKPIRTLVIHGDADPTVDVMNGRAITRQAVSAFKKARLPVSPRLSREALSGTGSERAVEYVSLDGRVMLRECIISGGSHAWSGGSKEGSFTQPNGPDASAELIRFFFDTADRLERNAGGSGTPSSPHAIT